jgi:hypothetical protein
MFMVRVLTRPVEDLARHGVVLVLCNVICCHHHDVVWTVTTSHQHLPAKRVREGEEREGVKKWRNAEVPNT